MSEQPKPEKEHEVIAKFRRGYFLTGKRTGIVYVFRRLRPTIAMKAGKKRGGIEEPDAPDAMRILSILCLHPLGYYAGSWAGVMTPTDDVIAHLSLMRGDEAIFWRKANHHESWRQESGL